MFLVTWKDDGGEKTYMLCNYTRDHETPWFEDRSQAEAVALDHLAKYPQDVVEIHPLYRSALAVRVTKPTPDPMIELRQRIIALAVDMGVWKKVEYLENLKMLLLEGEGHGDIGLRFDRVM